MSKYPTDRTPIVTNFGHRIQDYHRSATVQVGTGNANGEILVIQPHVKMPERDAITGALKNFGMLKDSYRATSLIVDYDMSERQVTQEDINRYYLRELIQIIQPALVVACGPEVLSMLRQRQVRSFSSHAGKKFKVTDITCSTFFAALNPTDYGFSRAPANLKEQGKAEWTEIADIYRKLKEKLAKERWAC